MNPTPSHHRLHHQEVDPIHLLPGPEEPALVRCRLSSDFVSLSVVDVDE
jgi:hypothetical protein